MTFEKAQETALCTMLRATGRGDLWAETIQPYGVLVIRNGAAAGVWSYYAGQFQYRTLATYAPIAFATDAEAALAETMQWLERTLS